MAGPSEWERGGLRCVEGRRTCCCKPKWSIASKLLCIESRYARRRLLSFCFPVAFLLLSCCFPSVCPWLRRLCARVALGCGALGGSARTASVQGVPGAGHWRAPAALRARCCVPALCPPTPRPPLPGLPGARRQYSASLFCLTRPPAPAARDAQGLAATPSPPPPGRILRSILFYFVWWAASSRSKTGQGQQTIGKRRRGETREGGGWGGGLAALEHSPTWGSNTTSRHMNRQMARNRAGCGRETTGRAHQR